MSTEQYHADATENKGQRGQQSGLGIAHPEVLDDGRQEEGNSVARRIQTEVDQSAQQDADIGERLKQGKMLDFLLVALLGCLHILQPRNLIFLQPVRLARKIGEI